MPYRNVALSVLGREVAVPGLNIETACPVQIGDWRVLPPLLNVPYVIAAIAAQAQVKRGRPMRYEVSLLNSGDRGYALDPCPVYRQGLAGSSTAYRLNCQIDTITAHRSVRFAMTLDVPADAPLGATRLTWMAVVADGTVIIADLSSGGAPITIVS